MVEFRFDGESLTDNFFTLCKALGIWCFLAKLISFFLIWNATEGRLQCTCKHEKKSEKELSTNYLTRFYPHMRSCECRLVSSIVSWG